MRDDDILILKGSEVNQLLGGLEEQVLQIVEAAYKVHGNGASSLPHSLFLTFPDEPRNRIIALPTYLGEEFDVAGLKWVSSFPANIERGMDRASAVVILNSPRTGRPEAILEGSIISAKRTAASAALAARYLQRERPARRAGLIGCGLINFEILRFLLVACPGIESLIIFDLSAERAGKFREKCMQTFGSLSIEVAKDMSEVLSGAPLVSLATTAAKPHIQDLSACAPGSTLLHVSLRDLSPEAILSGDNVVDDVDHVLRAQTSVHLAEQQIGHRDFIRCTLADILDGRAPARRDAQSVAIFSPFGLGILDLALARLVRDRALQQNRGTIIDSFLPESMYETENPATALK